jgi:hypothetical protein
MVRKFSSVRDFKCVATVEIREMKQQPQNENGKYFALLISYGFYDWSGTKLYQYRCSDLDQKTAALHFPTLEKYLRWVQKPIEKMADETRRRFFRDMSELFGSEVGSDTSIS